MDAKLVGSSDIGLVAGAKPVQGKAASNLVKSPDSVIDQVTISRNGATGRQSSAASYREAFNSALSKLNVASEVTGKISEYVSGVKGMLALAADPKTPTARVAILEQEAKALASEISDLSGKAEVDGTKILAGDPIVLELEKNIGKTLRVLLPTDAREAFGLKDISFTKADVIIQTRAAVERAARQIDELRTAVERATADFSRAGVEAEVALQNSEASGSSVRDLDDAVDLASNAVLQLTTKPKIALDSNSLTPRSLELLEP